jgi:tRNA ligase
MSQDPRVVADLCKSLESAKGSKNRGGKGKGFSCKKTTYTVAGSKGITVDSWRFQDWDYKRDDLPTYARGLFTTKLSNGDAEIASRGYDKFFNIEEVPSTHWEHITSNTQGPYELSVKENGCIIFISGLEDGSLLVCSKHSTGARADVEASHAMVGEKWVQKHIEAVGKSTQDLAIYLRQHNLTAVGELCDDEFEEHVLEYPPELAGLYIHGLNYNLPEFATMPSNKVHQFADEWGFKKAQYLMMDNVEEVKSFLEGCAETGSWNGRDTEGFVVRCMTRGGKDHLGPDWFFKYKFEEPYLMYRQWRECTKAIIAGKPPKYKKHKKITEEYLLFARRQLARDPKLAKAYNLNHGIIKMRDDFLAEKGQKGSDIIRQEQAEEGGQGEWTEHINNVVLVPIATIGCGKTTVASALVRLFDFGHVQNDNIEGQRGRAQRFALMVTNAMAQHRVVIADRNNHQRRERAQILDDVAKVVPEARFVALHWVHTPKQIMLDGIREVTRKRVLDRGDNHQTIRAGSKSQQEIINIMEGFLDRFQGCEPASEPDSGFDEVIDLDVSASSLENLETVVNRLYAAYPKLFGGEMPTFQDMSDAIDTALGSEVTTKHDLTFNKAPRVNKNQKSSRQNSEQPERVPTPQQLVTQLEYFSIPVPPNDITSTLESIFASSSAEEKRMYSLLKQTRRIQNDFHVTLIHRASARDHGKVWEQYTDAYNEAIKGADLADKALRAPVLGSARVKLERLVWDRRLMALVVRIFPSDDGRNWPCANAVAHITIGTANPDIKPMQSNELLAEWEAGNPNNAQMWEKEVPGQKVIEAKVKPVFQRGRG